MVEKAVFLSIVYVLGVVPTNFGFPQKLNEHNGFDEGYAPHGGYHSHFYEMTGWDASYVNYNDVPRLIEAMGGAETFTKRLLWACEYSVNYYNDDNGKEGYLNFTNDPFITYF